MGDHVTSKTRAEEGLLLAMLTCNMVSVLGVVNSCENILVHDSSQDGDYRNGRHQPHLRMTSTPWCIVWAQIRSQSRVVLCLDGESNPEMLNEKMGALYFIRLVAVFFRLKHVGGQEDLQRIAYTWYIFKSFFWFIGSGHIWRWIEVIDRFPWVVSCLRVCGWSDWCHKDAFVCCWGRENYVITVNWMETGGG